jgi:hypothetical protein
VSVIPPVQWRKSSYSGSEGGACVEVAALWRKSSFSGDEGGACVEVAAWHKSSHSSGEADSTCVEVADLRDFIGIRDSKDPDGPRLAISVEAFRALTGAIKRMD